MPRADAWSEGLVRRGHRGRPARRSPTWSPSAADEVRRSRGHLGGRRHRRAAADRGRRRGHRRAGVASALLDGVLAAAAADRGRPAAARGARGQPGRRSRLLRPPAASWRSTAGRATTPTARPRSWCSARCPEPDRVHHGSVNGAAPPGAGGLRGECRAGSASVEHWSFRSRCRVPGSVAGGGGDGDLGDADQQAGLDGVGLEDLVQQRGRDRGDLDLGALQGRGARTDWPAG